jgi:hypothetical protein
MFELWIPLTIAAALCQNLRSAGQKHLKAHLSTAGATYVRFLYARRSMSVIRRIPDPVQRDAECVHMTRLGLLTSPN